MTTHRLLACLLFVCCLCVLCHEQSVARQMTVNSVKWDNVPPITGNTTPAVKNPPTPPKPGWVEYLGSYTVDTNNGWSPKSAVYYYQDIPVPGQGGTVVSGALSFANGKMGLTKNNLIVPGKQALWAGTYNAWMAMVYERTNAQGVYEATSKLSSLETIVIK